MDLTQSASPPDTQSPADTEQLLVTNVSYEVEDVGYRVDTPILHVQTRRADGSKRELTVEGFRPFFAIEHTDALGQITDVANDRRVLGIEMDCSTRTADALGLEYGKGVTPADIAAHLSEQLNAVVHHTDDPYTTQAGEPVARIFTRVPGDVGGDGGLRGNLDCQTYEADIPFDRRFLISSGIYRGVEAPVETDNRKGPDRVVYENWAGDASSDDTTFTRQISPCDPPDIEARMVVYDIEVATEGEGFPDPAHARHPITAIAGYDSYTEEYRLWGLMSNEWESNGHTPEQISDDVAEQLADRDGFPDTDPHSSDPDVSSIKLFANETQLLSDFHDWVLECDPDIFTGYNADGFDTPYLIQRSYNRQARRIKQYSETGDPGVWVEEYDGERQVSFALSERVTLDILDAYKKTQYRELDSYKLDDVAEAELGYGKTGLAGDELDAAWHENPVDFFVYNIRDTQATVGVERESGLLDLFENLRDVTGAPYETAVSNGPMLDTMFLRRACEQRTVLPSNTEPDEGVYHGAKVFDTEPGVHANSVYPDLSSMYPSLFAMLNLGENTIIGGQDALEASEYTEDDCYQFPVDNRPFAEVPKGDSIGHVDRDEYKGVKTPNGGVREMFDPQYDWEYVLKPDIEESFIRDIVDDLIEMKDQYSGDMYAAVKRVVNSCFTPDTEVVTPDGIVGIRELDLGDEVYSFNPDTGTVELKPVVDIQAFPDYNDKLVDIQTSTIDFSVTPDHNMIAKRSRHSDEYEFVEAGDLNATTNYEMPHGWDTMGGEQLESVDLTEPLPLDEYDVWFTTDEHGRTVQAEINWTGTRQKIGNGEAARNGYRVSGETYKEHQQYIDTVAGDDVYIHKESGQKWVPAHYDGDDFIEFIGWFVTEGSTYVSERKEYESTTRGITHQINIEQYPGSDADQIRALLDRMGIDYYDGDTSFSFTSQIFTELLDDLCGCGSQNKKLPDFIWDVSTEQKQLLFDTVIAGDGDTQSTSYRYSTKSEQLRDDIVELCVQLGMNPRYTWDDSGEKNTGVWRIFYSDSKNTFRMERSGSGGGAGGTSTADDGVYCVTVKDNHTLLAGRNGKFQFVGQCYGVLGDSASGGKGSRLYNRKIAEGITLAGRLTITHTAELFTDYLRDSYDPDAYLVGGDTDSSVSAMPNAPSLAHARRWAQDGCEVVDASYDEFVQDQFGFAPGDTHRLHVELESLASKLFYLGGDETHTYSTNDDDMLVSEHGQESVKKRYAQHIVWDDDDGWLDTPDAEEYPGDPLEDTADLSELKHLDSVNFETYESGPLAGQDPHANIGIKGFEYVRSDSAQVTRDAQLELLTNILLLDDPSDEIDTYLNDLVDRVKDGDVPIEDLARPKGIGQQLDEYGWEDIEDISEDEITEDIETHGGRWRQRAGPTYRGAKYADDHFSWEQLGEGSKPLKIPIATVRSDTYPEVYTYETYPEGNRPDPPEVEDRVDAIAVERPERLPDAFEVDTDAIIEKELEDKMEDILVTMGLDWDDMLADGTQVGLDAF